MGEEHLRDLAKVLCSEEVSKFNCENDSLSALKIFELIMQLLAGRTWSLAVRRALPPEQYAECSLLRRKFARHPWSF